MQAFFWSLLLATVSAVTFIAYKHPIAFRKRVAPAFMALTGMTVAFITGSFAGGVSAVSDSLASEVDTLKGENTVLAFLAQSLRDQSEQYQLGLVICAIVFAHMTLLVFLPLILDLEQKSGSEGGS